MEKISEIYSRYKDYILFILLFIVFMIVSALIFYHFQSNIVALRKAIKDRPVVELKSRSEDDSKLIVDIKGAVNFLDKGSRVIDVIHKAGGLTRNADTSANNLSMKIKDEMVIVIYSKSEIKNYVKAKEKEKAVLAKCQSEKIENSSCVQSINGEEVERSNTSSSATKGENANKTTSGDSKTNSIDSTESNGKISINTATKEQLMTLTGIGESKADAIIEYRQNKRFETIENKK